jgi:hypothetical protein
VSDEFFNFLDKQKKETGVAYWACRPCTSYAQGMNHRMKQIEDDMKILKQTTAANTAAISTLEKKVEEVGEIARKADVMTKEEFEARMREEEEERKERKARELNVVIHGIDECGDSTQGGEERMRWDMQQCTELFSALQLGVSLNDIRFCRRVGAKRDASRPLVVGLQNERIRGKILRADWKSLEPEVSVCPDMTRKQREDEAQVWKDVEEKNSNRTPDEIAKNLEWRVVGQKGERRIVMGQARGAVQGRARGAVRGMERGGGGARGAGSTSYARRGASTWRGRQTRTRGAGRGGLLPPPAGAGRTWKPVVTQEEMEDEEEVEEIVLNSTQQNTGRARMGSKRKEREEDETMRTGEADEGTREPPAKH